MFYYRLAAHRGCSVAELLTTTSAVEMTEWRLVEGLEPFGERRADWRAAVTVARLLQVQGSKIKASDLLAELTDVFEQSDAPAEDLAAGDARQARIAASMKAWANRYARPPEA